MGEVSWLGQGHICNKLQSWYSNLRPYVQSQRPLWSLNFILKATRNPRDLQWMSEAFQLGSSMDECGWRRGQW